MAWPHPDQRDGVETDEVPSKRSKPQDERRSSAIFGIVRSVASGFFSKGNKVQPQQANKENQDVQMSPHFANDSTNKQQTCDN